MAACVGGRYVHMVSAGMKREMAVIILTSASKILVTAFYSTLSL